MFDRRLQDVKQDGNLYLTVALEWRAPYWA